MQRRTGLSYAQELTAKIPSLYRERNLEPSALLQTWDCADNKQDNMQTLVSGKSLYLWTKVIELSVQNIITSAPLFTLLSVGLGSVAGEFWSLLWQYDLP